MPFQLSGKNASNNERLREVLSRYLCDAVCLLLQGGLWLNSGDEMKISSL